MISDKRYVPLTDTELDGIRGGVQLMKSENKICFASGTEYALKCSYQEALDLLHELDTEHRGDLPAVMFDEIVRRAMTERGMI